MSKLDGHLNNVDFAIARNIRLGGARSLQFRVDIFNAFNTVNITGRQTQLQLNSPTDLTIRIRNFWPTAA